MIANNAKEKLTNAVIYFISNTNNCGKMKLYKLLSILDFQHFNETGRSVTGLDYYAWPKGPVPTQLENDLKGAATDPFEGKVEVTERDNASGWHALNFKSKVEFDGSSFTGRELRLLREIAEHHIDDNSDAMVEATHRPDSAWSKTVDRFGAGQQISYLMAIDGHGIPEDEARERMTDDAAIAQRFG